MYKWQIRVKRKAFPGIIAYGVPGFIIYLFDPGFISWMYWPNACLKA